MAEWTEYLAKSVILDVQVTQIDANQELQSPKSGTNGGIQITPIWNQTTNVPNGYMWDVTDLEIISPVDANGTFPDCQITIYNGTTKLDHIIIIDGSVAGNMFPRGVLTIGAKRHRLGIPLRSLLWANAQNPGSVSNMALLATGIKVTSSITIAVKSTAGWGNSGTAVTPLRVIMKGDKIKETDIIPLSNFYNGQIRITQPPTNVFNAVHVPKFPFTASNWGTLPGGDSQGGVNVFKRVVYAYNNAATSSGANFIFSQQNQLNGTDSNVVDQQHDLGFDFTTGNSAFLLTDFGVNTSANVYFGYRLNNVTVPQDTPNGTALSAGVNDFQYGSVQPQLSNSGRYYTMHDSEKFLKFLVYKSTAVPFINQGTYSSIAANDVSVALSGVLVQQN